MSTATTTKKNEYCRQLVQRNEVLAAAAAALKTAQVEYDETEKLAIAELREYGGRSSLTNKGILRILELETGVSVSREKKLNDSELVAWARCNGVEVKQQAPETVAPATLRKAVIAGIPHDGIAVVTETTRVNIT